METKCKSKKINLTIIYSFVLVTCAIFVSCSKGEEEEKQNNNNNEQSQIEEPLLSKKDLVGVWSPIDEEHSMYFISFSDDGRYSFCLNREIMGAGYFSIEKNAIVFSNSYLSTKDELTFWIEDNKLKGLMGNVKKFKSDTKRWINLELKKTDRKIPPSRIGEVLKNGTMTTDEYQETIEFRSEYLIHYLYKRKKSSKVLKEENWFYVCCDDMIYTQKCEGDGSVVIYRITNLRDSFEKQTVNQPLY